jgi:hypothetical protein
VREADALAARYKIASGCFRSCRSCALLEEMGEPAVAFLEVDPWFSRSDYIKGYLILGINRLPLTPDHIRTTSTKTSGAAAPRRVPHHCPAGGGPDFGFWKSA